MCGWTYLSDYKVNKVRKTRACIWCGETVEAGQPAYVQNGLAEGTDFCSNTYHPECEVACKQYFAENDYADCFEPYEFARGSVLDKHDYRLACEATHDQHR